MLRLLIILKLFSPILAHAQVSYRDTVRLSTGSKDIYSYRNESSGVYDNYNIIDLSADLEIGSTCGQIDVAANLRANMKELTSGEFFDGVGKSIGDAAPMLALCYMSPQACSIIKNFRLSSGLNSSLDLDACNSIESYQDQQVSVYERERSKCMRSALKRNGNNVRGALKECGQSSYEAKLSDWSGKSEKVSVNKLIESTANWAGLSGKEAEKTIELTKAFVGDTVIGKGGVDVDFGSRRRLLSFSGLVEETSQEVRKSLAELLSDYESDKTILHGGEGASRIKEIFGNGFPVDVAKSVVTRLSYLPKNQRSYAARKLIKELSKSQSISKAEDSLHLLKLASRNPNVPDDQKKEASQLRSQLQETLEVEMSMAEKSDERVAKTIETIEREGGAYEKWEQVGDSIADKGAEKYKQVVSQIYDCSEKLFCSKGGR